MKPKTIAILTILSLILLAFLAGLFIGWHYAMQTKVLTPWESSSKIKLEVGI